MKVVNLDHIFAEEVKSGSQTSILQLNDNKNLSVNDEIVLVDEVNSQDPSTWQPIGTAKIDTIVQKRLGNIVESDITGGLHYTSIDSILSGLQKTNGQDITSDTPVKIIHFEFSSHVPQMLTDDQMGVATDEVTIYADGGSRGNPGPSAGGYVILDDQNRQLIRRGVYLGITTNNQAEYTALKLALEDAKSYGAKEVNVYMDSMLVVNQMNGIFKVKNRDLWPIHDSVRQLTRLFRRVSFTQIPRELNKLADNAVNEALDQHLEVTHRTKS